MIFSVFQAVLVSVALTLGIASLLVLLPWKHDVAPEGGLDFSQTIGRQLDPLPLETLKLRDGSDMAVRVLAGPQDAPLILLVHGSGWHGMQFETLGRALSAHADVVIPDLRGHGVAPQRRGDVDYVGQLEDDLADLIAAKAKPGQPVILAGHSSGGGLVVRFAGGEHRDLITGAVLMAPFLQHDAPTTRPNSGGWAQISLRRMIGLSILNTFRITALNGAEVIRFTMPQAVLDGPLGHTATTSYSYRLNASYAPRRNWQADVAALPSFLLVAGSADEAFHAEAYAPTLQAESQRGQYVIVQGTSHLGVVEAPETAAAIVDFMAGLTR